MRPSGNPPPLGNLSCEMGRGGGRGKGGGGGGGFLRVQWERVRYELLTDVSEGGGGLFKARQFSSKALNEGRKRRRVKQRQSSRWTLSGIYIYIYII